MVNKWACVVQFHWPVIILSFTLCLKHILFQSSCPDTINSQPFTLCWMYVCVCVCALVAVLPHHHQFTLFSSFVITAQTVMWTSPLKLIGPLVFLFGDCQQLWTGSFNVSYCICTMKWKEEGQEIWAPLPLKKPPCSKETLACSPLTSGKDGFFLKQSGTNG